MSSSYRNGGYNGRKPENSARVGQRESRKASEGKKKATFADERLRSALRVRHQLRQLSIILHISTLDHISLSSFLTPYFLFRVRNCLAEIFITR